MPLQDLYKNLDPEARCINCGQALAVNQKAHAYFCVSEGCNKYGVLTMAHRLAAGMSQPVEHRKKETA